MGGTVVCQIWSFSMCTHVTSHTAPRCFLHPVVHGQRLNTWEEIPSSKLTWQWKITIFDRRYMFEPLFFHCHVGFLGCRCTEMFPIPFGTALFKPSEDCLLQYNNAIIQNSSKQKFSVEEMEPVWFLLVYHFTRKSRPQNSRWNERLVHLNMP